MELYTKRYNLYNYLIKDDFDYNSTKEYIYLWRNSLIILFAVLMGIIVYHYNNIDLFGLFVVAIIILFVYIIYFEINSYLANLISNEYLLNYKYYYEVLNSIFMENYDFTKDDDMNDKKEVIKNPVELITTSSEILSKYGTSITNDNFLQMLISDNDFLNDFLRNNYYLYDKKKYGDNIYIEIYDITMENKDILIENLFIKSSLEYRYLSQQPPDINQKYFMTKDNYFKIEISSDILTEEYQDLKYYIIDKMYYLFVIPLDSSMNPNTDVSVQDTYSITVDDINKKNDKLITSIATLKNSRTFVNLRFSNSEDNYESSSSLFKIKIDNKNKTGLINYIRTNQYYNYSISNEIITVMDNDFTEDVQFLQSISYEGIYENRSDVFIVNKNLNDVFYNDMNRDSYIYMNAYILNGGKTLIDENTDDMFTIFGSIFFNIGKFFYKNIDNYTNINPEIRKIPIIDKFYTTLYQSSSGLIKRYSLKVKDNLVSVAGNEPTYNDNGVVFKSGKYLKVPDIYYNTSSSNTYSFSFWFKTENNNNIIEFKSIDNSIRFRVKKSGGNLEFDINIGVGDKQRRYNKSKDLDFKEWHNVIIIIENNTKTISIYIDNELLETKELFLWLIAIGIAAGVGASRKGRELEELKFTENKIGDFDGEMKDFRIYNRKLTKDDIFYLYIHNSGIIVEKKFIQDYKDLYINSYQKTDYIVTKTESQIIINKNRLAEYKNLTSTSPSLSLNTFINKIDGKIALFNKHQAIINKKTRIMKDIDNNSNRYILSLTLNKINDTTIHEPRNSFIKSMIFNELFGYVDKRTKEITINEVVTGISNKKLFLKLKFNNIYYNRDKLEFDNPYIYELMKKIKITVDILKNSNYWETFDLIQGISEETRKIYFKIKLDNDSNNLKVESLNKNTYIKYYIYDLMERINYGERINNKFLEYLSENDVSTFKILLSYYNIKHKIKANIRFIENKTFDEINFNHYKKDILKFIDIYNDKDINVIKNYLFLREDTNIPNVKTYPDDMKVILKDDDNNYSEEKISDLIKEINITKEPFKYYLINLGKINKINLKESNFNFMKDFIQKLNDKYMMDIKSFDEFYKAINIKQNDGISKIIENFNYIFIKVIIVILIMVTIIFHVFYQEFIRYVR